MKKHLIFLILVCVSCWCGPVSADVDVITRVPEAHVITVLNAYNEMSGKHINMVSPESNTRIAYSFDGQRQGESQKQFIERAVRAGVLALIRLEAAGADRQKTKEDMAALPVHNTVIPDDVVVVAEE